MTGKGNDVTFYGASDDLVEFDGAIRAEFTSDQWRGLLTAPDGDALILTAEFGNSAGLVDWVLGIENSDTWPSWPIAFTTRPDREGDPAIRITVPEGTRVEELIW